MHKSLLFVLGKAGYISGAYFLLPKSIGSTTITIITNRGGCFGYNLPPLRWGCAVVVAAMATRNSNNKHAFIISGGRVENAAGIVQW